MLVTTSCIFLLATLSASSPLDYSRFYKSPSRLVSRAAGPKPIDLGVAEQYTIIAWSALTSQATSMVEGDVAIVPSAASYITGGYNPLAIDPATGAFAISAEVSGKVYAANYASPGQLTAAHDAMYTAYTSAGGATNPVAVNLGGGYIGGMTLQPGVYKFDRGVVISSDLTLNGSCTDVFIFQIDGVCSTAASTSIILTGGLMAGTIFWQLKGGMQSGVSSNFQGIVLSATTITIGGSATVTGRLYGQTSVDLNMATVTLPGACPVVNTTSSSSSSAMGGASTAAAPPAQSTAQAGGGGSTAAAPPGQSTAQGGGTTAAPPAQSTAQGGSGTTPPAGASSAKASPGDGGNQAAPSAKAGGRFARALGYFGMDNGPKDEEEFSTMLNSTVPLALTSTYSGKFFSSTKPRETHKLIPSSLPGSSTPSSNSPSSSSKLSSTSFGYTVQETASANIMSTSSTSSKIESSSRAGGE